MSSRAPVLGLGLLLLLPAAVSADGPRAADLGPDPEPLPAGVYWHSQAFGGCAHDECDPPGAAVVLGGPMSVGRAVRTARGVGSRVALGYPLLAQTDELGTPRAYGVGVAVVVGLFGDRHEAWSWAARRGGLGALRVVEVRDPFERHPEGGWQPRTVTRVDQRDAVAYDERAVARIAEEHGFESREAIAALRALRPLCTVPAGAAFVTSDPYSSAGNAWAPVRCGGRAAVTRVDAVLFRAVVLRDGNGNATLAQVVDVACDSAEVVKWRYSSEGREPIAGEAYEHPMDVRDGPPRSERCTHC